MPFRFNPLGLWDDEQQQPEYSIPVADEAPPTPEEESSLLGKTVGLAQYIGETLDKPGAAVRGVLGALSGVPGQTVGGALSNLIPFSDTRGITDPKQRVYGSDLLEQWGILDRKQPGEGFDWKDPGDWGRAAAGFGVDVVTDPLSLVGGPLSKIASGATKGMKLSAEALPALAKLSKAGKLGDVVSHTPVTVSAGLRTGEIPLATAHAPFWAQWLGASKEPWYEFGAKSGKVGELLAKGAAKANEAIAYSPISPVYYLRGLLSPAASGWATKGGSKYAVHPLETQTQILNDLNYSTRANILSGFENSMVAMKDADRTLKGLYGELAEHAKKTGNVPSYNEFSQRLAQNLHGIQQPEAIQAELQKVFNIPAGGPMEEVEKTARLADLFHKTLDPIRDANNFQWANIKQLGGNAPLLRQDLYVEYWHRGSTEAAEAKGQQRLLNRLSGRPAGLDNPSIERHDWTRDIPDGAVAIDRSAKSPLLMGFEVPEDAGGLYRNLETKRWVEGLQGALGSKETNLEKLRLQYLQEKILKPAMDRAWADNPNAARKIFDSDGNLIKTVTYATEQDELLGSTSKRAKALLSGLDGLSPNNRRVELLKAAEGASKADKAVYMQEYNAVGNGIWQKGVFNRSVIDDAVEQGRYMAETESTLRSAHNFLAQPRMVGFSKDMPDSAMLKRAWNQAGFKDKGLETFVRNNAQQLGVNPAQLADPKQLAGVIDDLRVPAGVEGALRNYQLVTQPAAQNALLGFADRLGSVYKSLLYSVWPASHVRDVLSDAWQAASHGKAPIWNTKENDRGILGGAQKFLKYIQKGDKPEFFDEAVDLGLIKNFEALDMLRHPAAREAIAKIPKPGAGVLGTLTQGAKEGSWKPWRLPGMPFMGEAALIEGKPMFAPMEIAARVQGLKHAVGQYGYFHALRKQGFSPAQAKHFVEQAFFTGDAQSKFGRDVASRMILFWRFASHNIPFQISKLAAEPGGLAAQTFRAVGEAASQVRPDVYTPRFMQEQQTIPVGPTDPAAQSFLRNTILPINDLNDIVMTGGRPDLRSLEKPLARLHPLALLPLELYAGRQTYSGRKIDELMSPMEKLIGTPVPIIDRLLHYLPTSRVQSEAFSTFDPRKTWAQTAANLMGIGSINTYDTEKFKNLDWDAALTKESKKIPGVREWTGLYVPKGKQAELSPEELARFKAISKRKNELMRQRKAMRDAKQRQLQ